MLQRKSNEVWQEDFCEWFEKEESKIIFQQATEKSIKIIEELKQARKVKWEDLHKPMDL